MKEAFGGKEISKGSNLGDDLKAAASDALKKAATMFGIGLHLYGKERGGNGKTQAQAELKPVKTNKVNGNGKTQVELKPLDNTNKVKINGNGNGGVGSNGSPKASMKQVRYIKDLCKELKLEIKINVAALSRDRASEIIEGLQRELMNRRNKN